MRALPFTRILIAASVVTCSSCASLKFGDRDDPAAESTEAAASEPGQPEVADSEAGDTVQSPPSPAYLDDGLRLPDDMLSLPSERELRRPPSEPAPGISGDVTARPPLDAQEPERD